jgi:hypothetical protein
MTYDPAFSAAFSAAKDIFEAYQGAAITAIRGLVTGSEPDAAGGAVMMAALGSMRGALLASCQAYICGARSIGMDDGAIAGDLSIRIQQLLLGANEALAEMIGAKK